MLAAPWVYSWDSLPRERLADEVRHYYFTKTRDLFRYAAFEFEAPRSRDCGGFLVLSMMRSRRRATVKVLDHEMQGPAAAREACALAMAAARAILADRIEFPVDLAATFRNDPLLSPLIKPQSLVGVGFAAGNNSPLALSMGRIELGMCDGDAAFT
jgi:hypothetical protein